MTQTLTIDRLAAALAALPPKRQLIAVVGAPGAGKSSLAETLCKRLNATRADRAAVVPMDGFHLDDAILGPAGLLPRKGAPETFDAGGLRHLLGRLKANAEPHIAIPVFDRDKELSRAAARIIPADTDLLLVEGNYLLLTTPPWDCLAELFDLTVTLDVPRETLDARLRQRWVDQGLPPETVEAKVMGNDLPNGDLVRAHSATADFKVVSGG